MKRSSKIWLSRKMAYNAAQKAEGLAKSYLHDKCSRLDAMYWRQRTLEFNWHVARHGFGNVPFDP